MMPPVRENSITKTKFLFLYRLIFERETERTKAPKKVARRVSQRLPFCSGAEGGTLKTFSFHCGGEVSLLH